MNAARNRPSVFPPYANMWSATEIDPALSSQLKRYQRRYRNSYYGGAISVTSLLSMDRHQMREYTFVSSGVPYALYGQTFIMWIVLIS